MAESSEVERILAQYGQGFQSPALSNYQADPQNELGTQVTTPDVQALLAERYSGFPGMLRGWADNVRGAVQPWSRTHATRQGPRVRGAGPEDNQLASGLETAANWINGTPRVGPDTLAPLGLASMGLPFAVPGAVGVFGGRLARTADHEALSRAEGMAARGAPREDIWNQTGWFRGPDGHWRFEINDSAMRHVIPLPEWLPRSEDGSPRMAPNLETAYTRAEDNLAPMAPVRAKRLFEHEELARAYPHGFTRNDQHSDIMGMPIQLIEGGNSAGMLRGNLPDATIGLHETLPPGHARSVLLHELQHAIQRREGFAEGSSAAHFSPERLRQEEFERHSRLIQEAMDANPEAAAAFRARNVYQARLRDMPPEMANSDAVLDELIRLDEILRNTEGGRTLADLDWQRRAVDRSPPEHWQEQARDRYRRTAGEVEARNVQTRRDFSPEGRRTIPPWQSQDVPDSEQILRQYRAP